MIYFNSWSDADSARLATCFTFRWVKTAQSLSTVLLTDREINMHCEWNVTFLSKVIKQSMGTIADLKMRWTPPCYNYCSRLACTWKTLNITRQQSKHTQPVCESCTWWSPYCILPVPSTCLSHLNKSAQAVLLHSSKFHNLSTDKDQNVLTHRTNVFQCTAALCNLCIRWSFLDILGVFDLITSSAESNQNALNH